MNQPDPPWTSPATLVLHHVQGHDPPRFLLGEQIRRAITSKVTAKGAATSLQTAQSRPGAALRQLRQNRQHRVEAAFVHPRPYVAAGPKPTFASAEPNPFKVPRATSRNRRGSGSDSCGIRGDLRLARLVQSPFALIRAGARVPEQTRRTRFSFGIAKPSGLRASMARPGARP